MLRVVLDTNVLVAAFLSRDGASFEVLRRVALEDQIRPCVSVPLVLEYEEVLRRKFGSEDDRIEPVLDYLCRVGERREIYFLWRPVLRDPSDEMVLEVAVEARAPVIVTHNVRDFRGVQEKFGIRALRPGALLMELEGQR